MRRMLVVLAVAGLVAVVAAIALSASPVKPPASLSASAGDRQITLTWPASTSSGITGYRVYRRGANGKWPTSALATTNATTTTHTDTGLTNGTAYAYRVTAVAGTRVSKPSPIATATPRAAVGGRCG